MIIIRTCSKPWHWWIHGQTTWAYCNFFTIFIFVIYVRFDRFNLIIFAIADCRNLGSNFFRTNASQLVISFRWHTSFIMDAVILSFLSLCQCSKCDWACVLAASYSRLKHTWFRYSSLTKCCRTGSTVQCHASQCHTWFHLKEDYMGGQDSHVVALQKYHLETFSSSQ